MSHKYANYEYLISQVLCQVLQATIHTHTIIVDPGRTFQAQALPLPMTQAIGDKQ